MSPFTGRPRGSVRVLALLVALEWAASAVNGSAYKCRTRRTLNTIANPYNNYNDSAAAAARGTYKTECAPAVGGDRNGINGKHEFWRVYQAEDRGTGLNEAGLRALFSESTQINWRVWVAVVCGMVTALLSSAGGVGGGGLYVPIFNLLLQFDSKTSAALSSSTIVGGIVVNVLWYSFQTRKQSPRRPKVTNYINHTSKPLIDYQVTLLCLPNLLLGISVGVIFNVMSPDWLVTAAFLLAISIMTIRTCRTAIRRWRTESAEISKPAPSPTTVPISTSTATVHDDDDEKRPNNSSNTSNGNAADAAAAAVDLERPLLAAAHRAPRESRVARLFRQFPPVEISLLALVWLIFLALQILRGASDGENLFSIATCGTVYWILTSLQIPLAILLSACAILYLGSTSATTRHQDPLAEEAEEEDGIRSYLADPRSMAKMSLIGLLVGVVGGMLGLGGGMIISPLLTEMGMDPQVTAATSSFMVFFSSSLSVVQYWLLGRIPGEYALVSALLALVFSAIGLQVVRSVIVRYGRVSLIIFSVSTVMAISAILMALFGSWDIWVQIQNGDYMGFQLPC